MPSIEIGRVAKTQPHLLADTIEILCAIEGGPVSQTDAYSLIQSATQTAEDALNLDEVDLDDDGNADDLSGAEISDRDQGYVEEAFRVIEYRSSSFGDNYPFTLEDERLHFRGIKNQGIALYLLLLSCSRLRSFKGKKARANLPDFFELVCRDALSRLMSKDAEVVCFGPKSTDRKAKFDSDLRKAIPKLADFMGMKLSPDWNPDEFAAQGDGQIDLIGVQRLDEFEKGWNVMIGQCAAHEDEKTWEKKRVEAMFRNHGAKFHSLVEPQAVFFVPVSYRQPNGRFVKKDKVEAVIFMDRDRIMAQFDPELPNFSLFSREFG